MFVIEKLATNSVQREQMIRAVADIEVIVQPQDAWTDKTLISLLEQDSIDLLIVYDQDKHTTSSMTRLPTIK